MFKGLAADKEDMNKLVLTPLIRCPLTGGSALITFEKAEGKSERALLWESVRVIWACQASLAAVLQPQHSQALLVLAKPSLCKAVPLSQSFRSPMPCPTDCLG